MPAMHLVIIPFNTSVVATIREGTTTTNKYKSDSTWTASRIGMAGVGIFLLGMLAMALVVIIVHR